MLKGMKSLLASSKGTLSLLILIVSTIAVMYGKIDGLAWSAIVSSVASIFMWTRMKSDCNAIK